MNAVWTVATSSLPRGPRRWRAVRDCSAPRSAATSVSPCGTTARNDRADPVTVQIAVVDSEGTTYEDDADQIDSGVARAFEVVVGTKGRHEVTVAGDDFRGQLAWDATICRLFDGQVSVTDDLVEVAGECVDQR